MSYLCQFELLKHCFFMREPFGLSIKKVIPKFLVFLLLVYFISILAYVILVLYVLLLKFTVDSTLVKSLLFVYLLGDRYELFLFIFIVRLQEVSYILEYGNFLLFLLCFSASAFDAIVLSLNALAVIVIILRISTFWRTGIAVVFIRVGLGWDSMFWLC